MKYLLDVSALVAWGWADHYHYSIVDRWFAHELKKGDALFLTCSITELGFVRVSGQQNEGEISVQEATQILHRMLRCLAPAHHFLPDDLQIEHWPSWCKNASQTTDAHLLLLAKKHGAHLARIFHVDRDEEAAKPGGARQANILTQGCMSTYCPSKNVSLTQHPSVFPDSAVDQHEISGLATLDQKIPGAFLISSQTHPPTP